MAAERQTRLDIRGLSKRYGAAQAIEDVSLSVEPGEVT